MLKKKWIKPMLIVLVRCKSEEMALDHCKRNFYMEVGSGNFNCCVPGFPCPCKADSPS